MAKVSFKKGLLAALPKTYEAGAFYVCTDERAMYLDISAEQRIRLGDFQEFATLEALAANPNPSTTALYYVTDINCMAKWNGAEYVQVNRDTGMTSVEVTGDGNAVTAAVYDAAGRKLTLTKGATYMTAADVDGKITEAVGTLGNDTEGNPYANVKAYVDAKTSGIATDAALGELQTQVTANKAAIEANAGDIDTLEAAIGEGGSVTTAIAVAKSAADAAQVDVDALEGKVGTPTEGKTIVEMIADAQTAATYDDSAVKGDIAQNAADIAAIKGDYLKAADKTELQAAIQAEADRADAAEKANAAAIAGVKEDVDAFLAAADVGDQAVDTLKEIQTYITEHGSAADEMVKNIAANKAAVEGEVTRATEAEQALSGRIDALEGSDHTHANKDELDKIVAGDKAKWDAAQANAEATAAAALGEAKTELEGKISAEQTRAEGIENGLDTRLTAVEGDYLKAADKTELSGAVSDEKTRAEKAEADLAGRLDTLEAIDHDAYKAYADQAEADAVQTANTALTEALTWGEF